MKSKISPTSPKSVLAQSSEVDDLYRQQLTTIDRPPKQRGVSVWLLFIVVLLGFLGGVIGAMLLLAYGPDIPFLAKFGLTTNAQQQYIITRQTSSRTASEAEFATIVDKASLSVVAVFEQRPDANDLSAVYLPEKSRGSGFIITNDGYILVAQETINTEANLVIVTGDGQVYPVQRTVKDPLTQLAFIKVEAKNLTTAPIADVKVLEVGQDIFLLRQAFQRNPLVAQTSIASLGYYSPQDSAFLIQSSEMLPGVIIMAGQQASLFEQGIAFTQNGEAVGVIIPGTSADSVIPFSYVKRGMNLVLSDKEIQRPYLGIHFVDIASTVGLPNTLTQSHSSGILIYSNDETAQPSIVSESPAQAAHLRKGDIITDVDGYPLNKANTLLESMLEHQPGDVLQLTYVRDGIEQSVKVTLGEL